jgi:hypothetical protein
MDKMKELKRNKRGIESDKILLSNIGEYPGLSQYELARKLGWNSGHVDSSTRRLLRSKKIFLEVIERSGRKVNLVYPKDREPLNLIEVPRQLLKIGNPVWKDQAFFYALDSSTIGISGKNVTEWKEISCFVEKIPIRSEEGRLLLSIPEKFLTFYNLDRKHRVVTINGNNILVTVSGDIIEEKNYPS